MQRDDSVYLHHILDAIAKIEDYTHAVGRETFIKESLIQNGVIPWVSFQRHKRVKIQRHFIGSIRSADFCNFTL